MDSKLLDRFGNKYWEELEVSNFNEDNRREVWYIKLLTESATGSGDEYSLLLTDQIRVWGRTSDAAQIEAERKEYANSMKKTNNRKIISLLEELLCKPSNSAHNDKTHQIMIEAANDTLTLQSSMAIDVYPFKWQFECMPIGTATEQAIVIRDQFIRPLQSVLHTLHTAHCTAAHTQCCLLNPHSLLCDGGGV